MGWKLVELFAEIGADDSKYKTAIAGVRASTQSAAATITSLGSTAMGVFAAIAGSAALRYILHNFNAQEQAENKLEASFRKVGIASDAALQRMREFASQIQETTVYGDDAVLSVASLGVNIGRLSGEGLERAVRAAIGFSRALDIDLHTAMVLVSRAAVGQTYMLTRYGIVVDQTATKQEQFNQVLEQGTNNFKLATAEVDTALGRWEQWKNAIGDIAESIPPLNESLWDKIFGITEFEKMTDKIPQSLDETRKQIEATIKEIERGGSRSTPLVYLENLLKRLREQENKFIFQDARSRLPQREPDEGAAPTDKQREEAQKSADQREKDMKRIRDSEFDAEQAFRGEIEKRKSAVKKEADDRIAEIERIEAKDIETEDRKMIAIRKIRDSAFRQIMDIEQEEKDRRRQQDEEYEKREVERIARIRERAQGDIKSDRQRLADIRERGEGLRSGSASDLINSIQQVVGDRNSEQVKKLQEHIAVSQKQLTKLGDMDGKLATIASKVGTAPVFT